MILRTGNMTMICYWIRMLAGKIRITMACWGAGTVIRTGARHALLRSQLADLRAYALKRRITASLRHVVIAIGGVDESNATELVLQALRDCSLPGDCRITVVMGLHAPWTDRVRQVAATMPWRTDVLLNVSAIARLMADSDLAIGAAGASALERCSLETRGLSRESAARCIGP